MDDTACRAFFTQPTQLYHRQYEVLRAIFVEGRSQKEVAQAFGYSYGALRQLVLKFRAEQDRLAAEPSPFFAE